MDRRQLMSPSSKKKKLIYKQRMHVERQTLGCSVSLPTHCPHHKLMCVYTASQERAISEILIKVAAMNAPLLDSTLPVFDKLRGGA